MSNSNRQRATYKKESAWAGGTTGSVKQLPHSGIDAGRTAQFFTSTLVRNDRMVADVVRGSFSASISIPSELVYQGVSPSTKTGLQDMIEWALMADATWTTPATDVTGADSTSTTVTKTGAFELADGWAVGQLARVTASGVVTHHVVTGRTDNALTLSPGGIASTTAGATVEQASTVTGGTTESSFLLELNYQDVTEFVQYPGTMIDSMALGISTNGPVSLSFTAIAQDEVDDGVTLGDPTSGYEATTSRVFDSVGHVKGVWAGASLTALSFTDFSMTLNNALAGREVVGTEGLESIRVGERMVTGSFTSYFSSNAQLDDFMSNTESAIFVAMRDAGGSSIMVFMPSVVITGARRVGGGKDSDIRVQFEYRAKLGSTYSYDIRIGKVDA